MDRYRFVSRDSSSPRYHIDKYEILDNNNHPVMQGRNPVVIERQVPKRVGKTRRDRGSV
jgi:hypothetical protein